MYWYIKHGALNDTQKNKIFFINIILYYEYHLKVYFVQLEKVHRNNDNLRWNLFR